MSIFYRLSDGVTGWRAFRILLVVIGLFLVFQVLLEFTNYGTRVDCYDHEVLSSYATFIILIVLALGLPQRLDRTLDLLRHQNTLVLSGAEIERIKHDMKARGRKIRFWSAIVITLCVVVPMFVIFGPQLARQWDTLSLYWSSGLPGSRSAVIISLLYLFFFIAIAGASGFFAGAFFGLTSTYGALADILSSAGTRLNIRPDHFDGANGMRPIGNFYLYQAVLTATPLIWFAFWWLFLPTIAAYKVSHCPLGGRDPQDVISAYVAWRIPYFIDWFVVFAFTIFGFIRPVFKLHNRIGKAKIELKASRLPEIEEQIGILQAHIAKPGLAAKDVELTTRMIDRLAREHWSIRNMSTWPMDNQTRRRYFSVNALAGVVPPAFQLVSSITRGGPLVPESLTKWMKPVLGLIF